VVHGRIEVNLIFPDFSNNDPIEGLLYIYTSGWT